MTTYQESEAEELMRDSEYPRFEHEETFTQSRTKIVSSNDLCRTDLNKNFIGTCPPLLGFNRPRPSANDSSARLPSITQNRCRRVPVTRRNRKSMRQYRGSIVQCTSQITRKCFRCIYSWKFRSYYSSCTRRQEKVAKCSKSRWKERRET